MATFIQKGKILKPGTHIRMVMARKFNGSFRGVDFLLSDQTLISLSNPNIKYVDGYGDGPREIISTCYVRFKNPNPVMCMNVHHEFVSYVSTPGGLDTIAVTSSGSMEDNTYEINKLEFHKDGVVVGSMLIPSVTGLKQTESLVTVDENFEVGVWRNPDGMTWVVPEKSPVNVSVVDGKWNNWSSWGSCIAGVDGASMRSRTRTCVAAQHGGLPCSGSKLQTESCVRSDGADNSAVVKPAAPVGDASPGSVVINTTQTQEDFNFMIWFIILILVVVGAYAMWPVDSTGTIGGMHQGFPHSDFPTADEKSPFVGY